MHACRHALVKPFSGRPRLVQWNTQGMMLPVLRWIFSVAVLQAIADRLNDHGNPAWIIPRDMIHGLLNGNPLRRTLANYISADRCWRWLKRCTVCGIWFPTVRGERCSRVCTDQWWSRARPNLEPHPEPDRCADLEERSGKPGPGGSPAAWWSDFVRIADLTGSAPFGPSGNALDAPWVPLMDRSLKTLIFRRYRDYPFGQ